MYETKAKTLIEHGLELEPASVLSCLAPGWGVTCDQE